MTRGGLLSESHPFLDDPVPQLAQVHINAIVKYWGGYVRSVPELLFASPSLGPPEVRDHLASLRSLLSPKQYAALRHEILARAECPTFEKRRAVHARDMEYEKEQERAAHVAREAAAREAVEAEMRQRQADKRLQAALVRVERMLDMRPWAVTDAALEAMLPPQESGPLVNRVRASIEEWFHARGHRASLAPPDSPQMDVIRTVGTSVLVRARAGSGKTRALIYRALFCTEWGDSSPEDILIVAFNKKAAEEVRDRLEAAGAQFPHVMTLHAFARAVANPKQGIVVDDDAEDETIGVLSALISKIVSQMFDSPELHHRIRQLMIGVARQTIDLLERMDLTEAAGLGLSRRRARTTEALDGTRVRDLDEKHVVDFLIEHGIRYQYRRERWMKGMTVRPLVTLAREHGPVALDFADGDVTAEQARRLVEGQFKVLTLQRPSPNSIEATYTEWAAVLASAGITARRLSEDELWERLRERARRTFNKLVQQYITRMQSQGLSTTQRHALLHAHESADRMEELFLELAERAYVIYLTTLQKQQRIDFAGVVSSAVQAIRDGKRTWRRRGASGDLRRLKHVMVDEFQDVSPLLMSLVEAIHSANPTVHVTGIGDDWQAINGFAGASTQYFLSFDRHFPGARTRTLPTNYRSAQRIVAVGNAIMADHGEPATCASAAPGELLVGELSTLMLSATEKVECQESLRLAAVRRIIADCLGRGESVAVLSRTRIPVPSWVVEDGQRGWVRAVRAGLSSDEGRNVAVGTVHTFKGREADTVILVDGSYYSFPLLAPTWRLFRILGDSLDSLIEDERRLLYVAATRAAKRLVCLVNGDRDELSSLFGNASDWFEVLRWTDYPPIIVRDEGKLVITVGNANAEAGEGTQAIKGLLQAAGFRYSPAPTPHWSKVIRLVTGSAAEQVPVQLQALQGAEWAVAGRALIVELLSGKHHTKQRFLVSGGVWTNF